MLFRSSLDITYDEETGSLEESETFFESYDVESADETPTSDAPDDTMSDTSEPVITTEAPSSEDTEAPATTEETTP